MRHGMGALKQISSNLISRPRTFAPVPPISFDGPVDWSSMVARWERLEEFIFTLSSSQDQIVLIRLKLKERGL